MLTFFFQKISKNFQHFIVYTEKYEEKKLMFLHTRDYNMNYHTFYEKNVDIFVSRYFAYSKKFIHGSLARQYFPVDNHTMLTNPLHCLRRDNLTAKQFELILHKNC